MHDGQLNLTAEFVESDGVNASQNLFSRLPERWARVARLGGLAGLVALAGCSGPATKAPIVEGADASGRISAPSSSGMVGTYVVKPGDTLHGIARTTNVDFETIKRLNNLTDPNQLMVGQVLRLSATGGTAKAPSGAATTGPVGSIKTGPATSMQPRPLDESATAKPEAASPPAVAVGPTTPAPDAGAINWAWPAGGALIQTFTASTKGIDISGTPGDPIKAAADGKVMYIGNGVRGLGNLVIVNHDNGFITVYGHNRSLLVKTGQAVKRGDKIAELGQTDTTSPRLHFEVRRRGTPVDPLRYLPPK